MYVEIYFQTAVIVKERLVEAVT